MTVHCESCHKPKYINDMDRKQYIEALYILEAVLKKDMALIITCSGCNSVIRLTSGLLKKGDGV